jgi:hypothetical protein
MGPWLTRASRSRCAADLSEHPIEHTPGFLAHTAALLLPHWLYRVPPMLQPVNDGRTPAQAAEAKARLEALTRRQDAGEKLSPAEMTELQKLASGRPSQSEAVKRRKREAEKELQKEAREEACDAFFEEAYQKHLGAIRLQQNLREGIDNLAQNTVGEIGAGVRQNIEATGEALGRACDALKEGRVLAAGTAVAAQAVKLATNTVATGAKMAVNTVGDAAKTAVGGVTDVAGQAGAAVDPMQLVAAYLQPVQEMLAGYLVPLRGLHGVLHWHDPAITTWLCLVLGVLAVVLPFLPWLIICRVAGAALLGPHMYIYGERSRREEEAANAEPEEAKWRARRYTPRPRTRTPRDPTLI